MSTDGLNRKDHSLNLILEDINVQSEEVVFEAFLAWVNYDSKRQTDRLAQLFSLIKLPLIDKKVRSMMNLFPIDQMFHFL